MMAWEHQLRVEELEKILGPKLLEQALKLLEDPITKEQDHHPSVHTMNKHNKRVVDVSALWHQEDSRKEADPYISKGARCLFDPDCWTENQDTIKSRIFT